MARLTPGRDFRFLWSAGIVSQLGDWSARLALALLVLERTSSARVVGIVALLFVLPWLGPGQVLTTFVARYARRPVLVSADALRGAILLVVGLADLSVPWLLVLVAIAATADPVFEATKSAYVTELVAPEQYPGAIQITHVANQAASLLGYGLGGVLVSAVGAERTITLNAISFFVSALLVSRARSAGGSDTQGGERASLRAALRYLRGDGVALVAFVGTIVTSAAGMAVESQAAVYGTVVGGLGEGGVGLLSACTPATTMLVVLGIQMRGTDAELLARGFALAIVASGAGAFVLGWGTGWTASFVGFGLVGVIFGFSSIANVVVGRRLPPDNRAAIFSVLQAGVFVALSTGSVVGGETSEAWSPEISAGGALAVSCGGSILLALLAYRSQRVPKPRHALVEQPPYPSGSPRSDLRR